MVSSRECRAFLCLFTILAGVAVVRAVMCPKNCSGHGKCETDKLAFASKVSPTKRSQNQAKVLFDGEKSSQGICGADSKYQKGGYFDRTWAWNACALTRGVEFDKCEWTLPTSYQASMEENSPSGIKAGVMVGLDSKFDANQKDRVWKFKFCHSSKIQLKDCAYAGYWSPTSPGTDFNFKCAKGKVVTAVKSEYLMNDGDRKWDYKCCTPVLAGCHCNKGFTGAGCEKPKCAGRPMCSGNGRCTMSPTGGICKCNKGHWGPSCKYKECPGKVKTDKFCNNHGTCDKAKGECMCDPGWGGSSCSWPKVSYSARSIMSTRSKLVGKSTPCHRLGGKGGKHKAARFVNDHCYVLFTDTKSFGQARRHCEKIGGYIVSITSDKEAGFVQGTFGPEMRKGYDVWLGLSNELSPDAWEWISGEIAVEGDNSLYGNWKKAPDRDGGLRCAIMQNDGEFKWRAEACSNKCQYVCEVPNIPKGYKPVVPKIPGFAKKFQLQVNDSIKRQRALLDPVEKSVRFLLNDVRAFLDQAERSEDVATRLKTTSLNAEGDIKIMRRRSNISDGYWASMRKMMWTLVNQVSSARESYDNLMERALRSLKRLRDMQGIIDKRATKLGTQVNGSGGMINSLTALLKKLAVENRAHKTKLEKGDKYVQEMMDKLELAFPKYLASAREQRDKINMMMMSSQGAADKESTSVKASLKKKSVKLEYDIKSINQGLKDLQDDMASVEESTVQEYGMQCNCIRGKMVDYLAAKEGWLWYYGSDGSWRTHIGGDDDVNTGVMCKCFGDQEDAFQYSVDGSKVDLSLVMSKEESSEPEP